MVQSDNQGRSSSLLKFTALPLTILTATSALLLTSSAISAAQIIDTVSVNVLEACSMSVDSNDSTAHEATIIGGTKNESVGLTTVDVLCNDQSGYSVYAMGVAGDGVTPSTDMVGANTGQLIPTGTDMTTTVSNWAMKLSVEDDSATYYVPTILSDTSGSFASNHIVPATNTKVLTYTSDMNSSLTSKTSRFTSTYAVAITPYQEADTYTGHVKYTLVHPNFASDDNKVYMQDLTPAMIADLMPAIGNSMTLYDSRDGQGYTVAKLADGKYWMTSDLDLAGGTVLSSDKSDVPSSNYYTLPASAAISSGTSVPSDQFSDNSTAYVFNTGNNTNNCTSSAPCNSYYSWLAATAGGKNSSGNAVTANGYNAAYSICPKGWRLPTSTTSNASPQTSPNWKTGDWYALATAYGANLESNYVDNTSATGANFYTNAGPGTTPNFLLAGYYSSGSFSNGGSRGLYWSSTAYSGTIAYSMYFSSSNVRSADSYYRRYGFSVRCVFDDRGIATAPITTLQEVTDRIAENTAIGDTATLKDSRDNQSYTIAKLNDGKIWMTSNLNLAGGTVLSSDKSDVPTDNYYTLPTSTAISSGTSVPSDQFSDNSTAYVFNTGNNTNNCTSSTPCNSYYSWLAATAGGKNSSGNEVTTNGYNAAYSICPKGWRLPTTTTSNASATTSSNWETGDWYQMIIQYMGGATSLGHGYYDNTNPNPFLTNAGPGTAPNFLLAGYYYSGSLYNGGSYGSYWSSTARSSTGAYVMLFYSGYVNSANNVDRRFGDSVRCVLDA